MRFLTLIAITMLSLLMAGCVHRTKMQPMEEQCVHLMKQAQELYRLQAKTRDRRIADEAANLITGAQIAREHQEFMQCLDKSGRAIKLLDQNAKLSVQYDN